MIAILAKGKTISFLRITPDADNPGVGTAEEITLAEAFGVKPLTGYLPPDPPEPVVRKKRKRRSKKPSAAREEQVSKVQNYLLGLPSGKNSVPAYSTIRRLCPGLSGGSVDNVIDLGIRRKI